MNAAPAPPAPAAGKRNVPPAPDAAAALSLQDRLRSDAVALHAASFLAAADLGRLVGCAAHWRGLLLGEGSGWLWRDALGHEENGPALLRRLEQHAPTSQATTAALVGACGQAHRLSRLDAGAPMRWATVPAALAGTGGRWPIRAMEGHAATLLADRWMAVVGGFGMRGVENEVYVLDTWALDGVGKAGGGAAAVWWRLADRGQRPFPPLYGHAVAALGPRRLAVFGGCTMGGYAGDVNGLWFVDVEIDGDGERGAVDVGFGGGGRPRLGGVAVWRRVQTLGQTLTSRAYCTLTPLPEPGGGEVRRLLVLGGIHEGRATLNLELVEIRSDGTGDEEEDDGSPLVEVIKPVATGPRPHVRMGHSCVLLPPATTDGGNDTTTSWRLLVLGGSDGSDLLRNGEEHGDVWLLDAATTASPPQQQDGGGAGPASSFRFAWRRPLLLRPSPWWFPIGRTHTAQHVGGGVVLCFGGGASLSNRLGLLDTNTWAFSSPRLLWPAATNPHTTSHAPVVVRPRLSHAAVRSGARLLVHGGWNGREMGDLLSLDLAPPLPKSGQEADLYEEDDDEDGAGPPPSGPRVECAQS